MEENQATEGTEESGTGGDSEPMAELRKQLKASKAETKEALGKTETAKEEARAEVLYEASVEQFVNAAGYPGLVGTVLDKLDGQEVTAEAVHSVLVNDLKLPAELKTPEGDGSPAKVEAKEGEAAKALAGTATLGQQLAAAASGAGEGDDVIASINETKTPEEVAAIAEKGGFLDTS